MLLHNTGGTLFKSFVMVQHMIPLGIGTSRYQIKSDRLINGGMIGKGREAASHAHGTVNGAISLPSCPRVPQLPLRRHHLILGRCLVGDCKRKR